MARGDPQINVRIPGDAYAFLAGQVQRYGSSLSSEVTRAVRERMDREIATTGSDFADRSPAVAGNNADQEINNAIDR